MSSLVSNTTEKIKVPGTGRMVLWGYKQDSVTVWDYIKKLQNLEWEIRYCRKRYPEIRRQLKRIKHNLQTEFNNNLDRIWNDQRSGTLWRKGERFEPHQVSIRHNLVMWDGLTRFTEIISGESTDYFDFMAMGEGESEPHFAEFALEDEVARVDMKVSGDINSDGITLKSTAAFPPGVPNADIKEFGAFDTDGAGVMEYRVLVEGNPLEHRQGDTFVQASHTIVLQPVENVLE